MRGCGNAYERKYLAILSASGPSYGLAPVTASSHYVYISFLLWLLLHSIYFYINIQCTVNVVIPVQTLDTRLIMNRMQNESITSDQFEYSMTEIKSSPNVN